MSCPCGRERPYAECCGPLHQGDRQAATAEDLMRSRYAAFVRGKAGYLAKTLHPDKRQGSGGLPVGIRWTGLTIVETTGGSALDAVGTVTFEARYETAKTRGVMRERSRFVRLDGAWHYLDGDLSDTESDKARGG